MSGSKPEGPSLHPGIIITIPGIAITMTAESLLRSFRNAHHDHFGIAITVPRNPQVAKAERLEKGASPRFVLTSLSPAAWDAQALYEEIYCARGEMENRVKEQLMLFADRTSTAFLRSNQNRLYFSSLAYLLMEALRRLGLKATELAQAQAATIRLQLLKIGALIRITVRKVWVSLAGGYPYSELWARVLSALQAIPLRR